MPASAKEVREFGIHFLDGGSKTTDGSTRLRGKGFVSLVSEGESFVVAFVGGRTNSMEIETDSGQVFFTVLGSGPTVTQRGQLRLQIL